MFGFSIKRLFKEPLLHFLFLGFLLFLFYDYRQGQYTQAPNIIQVSSQQISQISSRFTLTKLRPPIQSELDALIEEYVRDEVFYREAIAMGLDQGDPQVRSRMRRKLEFFLEDLLVAEPDEEELEAFYAQHADTFKYDTQFSFQQFFINPKNHADASKQALALLQGINERGAFDGFDHTLLPFEFTLMSSREIDNYLGGGVASQLEQFAVNSWQGPIMSSFGLHIVKVTESQPGELPSFASIREKVLRDYEAYHRVEQKEQAYEVMRKRYKIVVDPMISNADEITSLR